MKNRHNSEIQTPEALLTDLRTLVNEAEKMIGASVSEHTADAMSALRTRYEAASERMGELYEGAKTRVVAGAKSTDQAIRENPYQSLAIALGAGLLIGVLLGRRSK